MLNTKSLKQLIQSKTDGNSITSDQMKQMLSNGSFNVTDVANFLDTISVEILEKAIIKTKEIVQHKRLYEQKLLLPLINVSSSKH